MNTDHDPTEATGTAKAAGHLDSRRYDVRVDGHLESRWAAWFDGLELSTEEDGTTVIHGSLVDQAALHGLLQKLRDLGIPLVSVTQLPPDAPTGRRDVGSQPTPQDQTGATP